MRSPVEGEAEHARPLLLDHELLLPEQLRQELAQPRRHRRHDHGVVIAAGLRRRPLPLAGEPGAGRVAPPRPADADPPVLR